MDTTDHIEDAIMTAKTSPPTQARTHAGVEKARVLIFDTTLRDGEQCPGATMTFEEKLEIAELLDEMGVDIIEAGFPIASDGDFEAVADIAKRVKKAIIAGLARAIARTSTGPARRCGRRAARASIRSSRPRRFISRTRCARSRARCWRSSRATVARARNLVEDVEWSAMDATRTPIDYLCHCVDAAIKAGATTINLPDTVGYADAGRVPRHVPGAPERVPASDKAIFSMHCHNDLGLAVANSLAGVDGGARQVECTINGLGERAGNAALEEVVMAIRTRRDVLPYETGIEATLLNRASRLVSAVTSFPVQYNKAIVGGTPSRTRAASTRTAC